MENYITLAIGAVLTVFGYLVVKVLNGIELRIGEIREEVGHIKTYMSKIETDLHGRVTEIERRHDDKYVDLDRRLVGVETRCTVVHKDQ